MITLVITQFFDQRGEPNPRVEKRVRFFGSIEEANAAITSMLRDRTHFSWEAYRSDFVHWGSGGEAVHIGTDRLLDETENPTFKG